ncbi:MAG: GIY-YIG nuclease family protein [Acidobacteriia bacterium]|nr:GIY-YIG nuclease family protein [Terriglobia bacterium]
MWDSQNRRPDQQRCFYVYIMASKNRVLYIGVTNSLAKRVWQHKTHEIEGFTSKYKVHTLVHFESFDDVRNAIDREKVLKGWTRAKKIALIEETNSKWKDLAEGWYRKLSDEQMKKQFARRNPAGAGSGEKPVN